MIYQNLPHPFISFLSFSKTIAGASHLETYQFEFFAKTVNDTYEENLNSVRKICLSQILAASDLFEISTQSIKVS